MENDCVPVVNVCRIHQKGKLMGVMLGGFQAGPSLPQGRGARPADLTASDKAELHFLS